VQSIRVCSIVVAFVLSACVGPGDRSGPASDCAAALLPGDLVVSEIMADPAGPDDGFEWFEIYNASGVDVDLDGAVLRSRRVDGTGEKGHVVEGASIAAGERIVVGNLLDDPSLLPPHVDYGYGNALGLGNASGELSILCGDAMIDVAIYAEAGSGASRGFDGARTPDAVANDALAAWCDARTPFGEDALGSPGAPNDACFGSTPATCIEGGRERATDPPRAGDLVVTEVMPDPARVDDGVGEWLEVAVQRDLDLNGLGIGKRGEDPVDVVGSVECVRVRAGAHLLFAASDDAGENGGLPPRDHPLTLPLPNDEGETSVPSVELRWGERALDVVTWTKSDPGRALNLDPDLVDPDANDGEGAFCPAERPYGSGDLGSPGGRNHHCLALGECLEGDVPRPVRAPAAGDLLVSEIMAQPEAVAHADGEWFELRALAAFDLNGLELGEDGAVEETITSEACLPVEPGEHLVFARNGDPMSNGGLPRVAGTYGFALSNADAFFVGHGGVVVDEVAWAESTPGSAQSLDGDDARRWCDAITPYGAGDLGTPGAANPACGEARPSCDGAGAVRMPATGDVVIVELMADPMAVGDEHGEFFEVLVTADVDLEGLQIGRTEEMTDAVLGSAEACLAVAAGQRVVFARSDDPAHNGGIEGVVATFSFNLANAGGTLFIGHDGEVLDAIAWSGSTSGASLAVMPGHETATGNDDAAHLCTSGPPYGDGDRGTPGAPNACE
jgi:hypothetical protein